MISRLRFSLIAVIMLVFVGFGFQNQAQGQVGLNGLFCPAVPDPTGWLMTEIISTSADFSGGLIGTVEDSGFDAVGGLDWQQVDSPTSTFNDDGTHTPTNEAGAQLVSWWTQLDGRNTYIQVTNAHSSGVNVHVRIHRGDDCAEIRDFCDFYTGFDTHEYNFGNLFANNGADIADGNLQGVEGWVVVTAVKDCGSTDELPLDHNYLTGQLIVHDSDDYLYGVNTYARQAVCFDIDDIIEVNRVANGSFQNELDNWDEEQSHVTTALFDQFSGAVILPPVNPYDSPFMGFAIATDRDGFASGDCYEGGSFDNSDLTPVPVTCDLVELPGGAGDDNVALLESDSFEVFPGDSSTLSYNIRMFTPEDGAFEDCNNYLAVQLIRIDGVGPLTGTITDAKCYQDEQRDDVGNIDFDGGNFDCIGLSDSDDDISFPPVFEFDGASSWLLGETLQTDGPGDYIIQVIAGQVDIGGDDCVGDAFDTGALVNNFQLIGEEEIVDECDDCLDGRVNARLDIIDPEVLYGQFNILPANLEAGADVVLINFADDYGNGPGNVGQGPYRPVAAFTDYFISIFDEFEVDQSCGDTTVCFVRYGIDDALVKSEDFNPATPTPTPTPTPTATPTSTPTPTPTPTPSPTGGGGGGGSCAIAGSPVQLGTALANVLIPLVPVAFAFGVRAVRRRKK